MKTTKVNSCRWFLVIFLFTLLSVVAWQSVACSDLLNAPSKGVPTIGGRKPLKKFLKDEHGSIGSQRYRDKIDELAGTSKRSQRDFLDLPDKPPVVRKTNPKHHQNSKSPEPSNVDELFDNSIVDKSGVRWAKNSDGTTHRFSESSNGETHWNGSTSGPNSIKQNNIPHDIRKKLK